MSSLKVTGLTTVMYNTITNLDKEKFDPMVVTLNGESGSEYEKSLSLIGVKIIHLSENRFAINSIVKRVNNIICSYKVGLVHSHCLRSFIVSSFLSETITLMTLHSIVRLNYKYEFGLVKGAILDRVVDFCIKRHDLAIGVAKSVQSDYKIKKGLEIECVTNGTDLEQFKFDRESRVQLRRLLGIENDVLVKMYTGSISKRKNVTSIIESLSSDKVLLLVGDGPQMKALKEKYAERKNIRFLGRRNDIQALLCAADVFVSHSLSEGMPNSVIEALANGLPCELSAIPAHMELSTEFPSLIKIKTNCPNISLTDAKYRLKLNKTVGSLFSSEKMTLGYENLYEYIYNKNRLDN